MNIDEIIRETNKLERDISVYSELIRLLKDDLLLEEKEKYRLLYAIDYAELYRYLHPHLDRTRLIDKDVFFTEQLAIRYLFDRMPISLIFLPAHHEELKRHLSRMRKEMAVYSLAADRFLSFKEYLSLLKRNSKLKKVLEALDEAPDMEEEYIRDALMEARRLFLDLLIDKVREDTLNKSIDRINILVKDKKLLLLSMLENVRTDFTISTTDEKYQMLYIAMCEKRQNMEVSNDIDTRAILTISKLNEMNSKDKNLFLLISSSKLIRDELTSIKMSLNIEQEVKTIHFLREPRYFLLRFFYEGKDFSYIIDNLRDTQTLMGRYQSATARFRYLVSKKQAEGLEDIKDDLMKTFEVLKDKITLLKGLHPSQQDSPFFVKVKEAATREETDYAYMLALLKMINEIIKDGDKLREHIYNTIKDLTTAIVKIDQKICLLEQ